MLSSMIAAQFAQCVFTDWLMYRLTAVVRHYLPVGAVVSHHLPTNAIGYGI